MPSARTGLPSAARSSRNPGSRPISILEESQAQRQQALQQEYEETLQNITNHHDEEHIRLTDEADASRTNLEELYAADKEQAEATFKEAHWTILTLNESDKRVARDQLLRAHHKLKESRSELKSTYLKIRQLVRSWKFAENLTVYLNYQPKLTPVDPWKNLEQRRDIIFDCRDRLQRSRCRGCWKGTFCCWPRWGLAAAVVAGALHDLVVLSGCRSSRSWSGPRSRLARYWMTRTARLRVALLWQGLAQAFIDAKPLRQLCLQQARKTYKAQRKQSRAKHRASMQKAVDKYRRRKRILKTRLRQQLALIEGEYQAAIEQIAQQRDQDLQSTHENFAVVATGIAGPVRTRHAGRRGTAAPARRGERCPPLREWQKLVAGLARGL